MTRRLRQAVVLAGGRGTRLGEVTAAVPKPMAMVAGHPFLEHVLWNLRRHGLRDVILSVGYLADVIVAHFGDGSRFGVRIRYLHEESPAGTAGPLLLGKDLLDERFLFLNGDTLFDFNYCDLPLALQEGALAHLALREVDGVERYGAVRLEGGRVVGFAEKGGAGAGLINGGVALLSREVVAAVRDLPCSLEKDVLPALVQAGRVSGKAYQGYFIDIGTPASLATAQEEVAAWSTRPAAFLDRDGVINENLGHVCSEERFRFVPGAPAAIRLLNERGYLVIVVTNQAGIARGLYGEEQFLAFTDWIDGQLAAHGAHVDATYHCPHHPTEAAVPRYAVDCRCRKPRPGMLLRALAEWRVDPGRSFLVGDKDHDLAAAAAAGVQGHLFPGGDLLEFVGARLGTAAGATA